MAFNATKEQKLAINTDGNVLVAAAAGSGKTAVLVERVMRLLTDENDPVNADELLIVTFTNAAAAEMRTRIEKKLAALCTEQPDNKRLREQRYLLPSAKICTIDSFCIELVRENFDRAGVSPDFRIADESAMQPLRDAAFSKVMNDFFQNEPELMRELLDISGADYDDSCFRAVVERIFAASCNQPFPEIYIKQLRQAGEKHFDRFHPWFSEMLNLAEIRITEMLNSVSSAEILVRETAAKRTAGYTRALNEMASQLSEMLGCISEEDWDGLYGKINGYDHSPLNGTSTGGLPELIAVKTVISENGKNEGKKALLKLIFADTAQINEINNRMSRPIDLLLKFVLSYSDELFKLQQRENRYTFYNTEQMALSMLCEIKNGKTELRDDADIFLNRYRAVLVDEYQDTNDLQDTLFKVLSNHEEHLFAVGDVKQSIYAFRGANPDNFLRKKAAAVPVGAAEAGNIKKVILARNFRSRKGVCDYINFFFGELMTKENGRLVYDDDEKLISENAFPENGEICTELLIMDRGEKSSPEDEEEESSAAIAEEARVIADYIRNTVSGKAFLKDGDKLRKANYGDFAILMRNQKNRSSQLAEELRKQGIPVNFSKENFLEALEIRTFCALLEVVNNPKQDIPLLTVMLSPIFGFSAETVAQLRADRPQGSLFSAVTAAANNGDIYTKNFLERIKEMRAKSVMLPLPRLLHKLLTETDYLNLVSAMQDGARRRANLLLLCDYATSYYDGGSGTLGGFLRMLRNMPQGAVKAAKTGGGNDSVCLMSMHASKGLQFPICILCDLGVNMHKNTERQNIHFSPEDGVGFRFFDEKAREKRVSPAYCVIGNRLREERLAEELRLLYVAMTRAEEKLIIISHNKKLSDKLVTMSSGLLAGGSKINRALFNKTSSMNDWILMTALLHPDGAPLRRLSGIPINIASSESNFKIKLLTDIPAAVQSEEKMVDENPDNMLIELLKENFSYSYPFSPLFEIEAKSTVSRLANSAESESLSFTAKPSILEADGISAADRGTANHRIMQFIHFEEKPDIESELERLYEWHFISEMQYRAADRAAIAGFFESRLYSRILKSPEIHREMRFLTEIPAGRLHSGLPGKIENEAVVVQGAVDLCFKEDDGIVIVDFKTDRVTSPEALAEAYREQLIFYAAACEKIFELPVREKVLYSFALGTEIKV